MAKICRFSNSIIGTGPGGAVTFNLMTLSIIDSKATQHNDAQHNGINGNTQHNVVLCATFLIMPNVARLSVVMLRVVAPGLWPISLICHVGNYVVL